MLECNSVIYLTTTALCSIPVFARTRVNFWKPYDIVFCVIFVSPNHLFRTYSPAYMSRREPDQIISWDRTNKRFIFRVVSPVANLLEPIWTHHPFPLWNASFFSLAWFIHTGEIGKDDDDDSAFKPSPVPPAEPQLELSLKSLHSRRSWRLFPVARSRIDLVWIPYGKRLCSGGYCLSYSVCPGDNLSPLR